MWKISSQPFGFVLTFSGKLDTLSLQAWIDEAKQRLAEPLPENWGIIVDMRKLLPLDDDAQLLMTQGQKEFKSRGMSRVAVVLVDAITILQFRRLGRSSGVAPLERFINAQSTPNWQAVAKQWVVDGIESPRLST